MSTNIVYTASGTDFTSVYPTILVDVNGNPINIVTSGSATYVSSLNGLTNAVTLAGQGDISVSTSGQTINFSGSGLGNVTGPASANSLSIAVFNGGTGKIIAGSAYGISSNILSTTGTMFMTTGSQDVVIAPDRNIQLGPGSGTIIAVGDIRPQGSGTMGIGTPAFPFSGVYANQYGTSYISTIATSGTISIDWNNGSVQQQSLIVSGINSIGLTNGLVGSTYVLKTVNVSGLSTTAWTGGNIKWAGGTSGTTTATTGAIDLFSFVYDGSNYLANQNNDYK